MSNVHRRSVWLGWLILGCPSSGPATGTEADTTGGESLADGDR